MIQMAVALSAGPKLLRSQAAASGVSNIEQVYCVCSCQALAEFYYAG